MAERMINLLLWSNSVIFLRLLRKFFQNNNESFPSLIFLAENGGGPEIIFRAEAVGVTGGPGTSTGRDFPSLPVEVRLRNWCWWVSNSELVCVCVYDLCAKCKFRVSSLTLIFSFSSFHIDATHTLTWTWNFN